MAAETNVALIAHACPPHLIRRFLDLVADHDLDPVLADVQESPPDGALLLGAVYAHPQHSVGWAYDVHAHLLHVAPEASWTVWQGTVHDAEGWGQLFRHHPPMGTFSSMCDDAGDPMLFGSEIAEIERMYESMSSRWYAARMRTGATWADALGALPAETVTEPPRWEFCWDRRTGVVEVEGVGPLPGVVPWQGDDATENAALVDFLALKGWHVVAPGAAGLTRTRRVVEGEAYRVETPATAGGAL